VTGGSSIPVYRARLPSAERLLPYLAILDETRWYTNRGQLVCELERRLATMFGTHTITAASGTAAIEGAILAAAGRATPERPLALMPAYTFVATAMAAERCGYVPYLIDVDDATWSLELAAVSDHPKLARAGVVIPVGPYGCPPQQAGWAAFVARTGVAVVIDAAAAFERISADPLRFVGDVPVALSFQVTKAFSSGEGGAVIWSDYEGLSRVARSLNFGFIHKRESTGPGTNGKMSEYHAAVGLASLDVWPEKCAANTRVSETYRGAAGAHGVADRLVIAPAIASNYALFVAGSEDEARDVMEALLDARIESRLWYGRGLHREPYFSSVARDPTPCADRIAPTVIGLPVFEDISGDEIERIVAVVAGAVRKERGGPASIRPR